MRRLPLVLVIVAACSADGGPAAHKTSPLWSDGANLRDDQGRIALLHGVNARVDGVFDVTFSDGRTALEPIPALTDDDCTRMRALGFDFLRLPINWSGIEPTEGNYDEDYLQKVDAAIGCAQRAGVLVLIDLHEDAYSKEIGEDGAPLWAIVPPPTMLLQGPMTSDDLYMRRTSSQVMAAFNSFFDTADTAHLQAKYGDMLEEVARRWAEQPDVLGFELFNEPSVGEDPVEAFSPAAAARIRAVAPDKLVFFEPSASRNIFDSVPTAAAPFPVTNAVYAPHIYTALSGTSTDFTLSRLEPSVQAAREEADAWGTPLLIGEYGCGPADPCGVWAGLEQEIHDKYLASDAWWLWKEESQGNYGLFDHDAATDTWTERPQVVQWLSRVHAARIAGTVISNAYDPTSGAVTLSVVKSSTGGAAQEIFVPERAAATFQVTCDGAARTPTRDAATGLVEVACDGVLTVTPGM